MMKIFSNDCPRCKVLKQKLEAANITFETEEDMTEIIEKNFQTIPILKYNDEYYQFGEAVQLIQKIQSGELEYEN